MHVQTSRMFILSLHTYKSTLITQLASNSRGANNTFNCSHTANKVQAQGAKGDGYGKGMNMSESVIQHSVRQQKKLEKCTLVEKWKGLIKPTTIPYTSMAIFKCVRTN